jgi:hypothetical protein
MRIRTLCAAVLVGLLVVALAPVAWAQQRNEVTLSVDQRWGSAAGAYSWNPYLITVRANGRTGFDGEVVLVPDSQNGPIPEGTFPIYRGSLSVPAGSERSVEVFALEAPGGYHAELRDGGGRVITIARAPSRTRAMATLGVLSDLRQADQQIQGPLKAFTRLDVAISTFASGPPFPTSALFLSGLDAVILDRFDTGSLSQAQIRALKDFVGLGGTLILGGGGSWRRTLLPLPSELLPLRPSATGEASLAPLAEPAGLAQPGTGQVATGDLASWARVAVASPEGTPLMVEGDLGSGRVLELTFDPLAAPFDGRLDLTGLTWGETISRALGGLANPSASQTRFGFNVGSQFGVLGGSGPGSMQPAPGALDQALNAQPALPSPPFALLIGLLILYVLAVSLGSYAVLRRLGRRGLLWLTVPLIALLCTGASYGVGTVSRGSDFRLTQFQVQRLGPGGVSETYSVDRVASPRRGDVRIDGDAESLATTALAGGGGSMPGQARPEVSMGPRPEVRFTDVPIWDVRAMQTLSLAHGGGGGSRTMPVEARLSLVRGRLVGSVINNSGRALHDVQVASPSGAGATLVQTLAPGATASVDAPFVRGQPAPPGKGGPVPVPLPAKTGVIISGSGPQPAMSWLAAMLSGQLSLVAGADLVGAPRVEGGSPARSGRATVVEPLHLESVDALSGVAPAARLVASWAGSGTSSTSTDTYEFVLPGGLPGKVGAEAMLFPSAGQPSTRSVEVYDWTNGAWRALPAPGMPGASLVPTRLTAGEMAGGVVRLRVGEDTPGQVSLGLVDMP